MVTLGVVLLVVGFLIGSPLLWTLGIVFFAIGIVLWIFGAIGREIGGHRHYF